MAQLGQVSHNFLTDLIGEEVEIILPSNEALFGVLLGFDEFTLILNQFDSMLTESRTPKLLVFKHSIKSVSGA